MDYSVSNIQNKNVKNIFKEIIEEPEKYLIRNNLLNAAISLFLLLVFWNNLYGSLSKQTLIIIFVATVIFLNLLTLIEEKYEKIDSSKFILLTILALIASLLIIEKLPNRLSVIYENSLIKVNALSIARLFLITSLISNIILIGEERRSTRLAREGGVYSLSLANLVLSLNLIFNTEINLLEFFFVIYFIIFIANNNLTYHSVTTYKNIYLNSFHRILNIIFFRTTLFFLITFIVFILLKYSLRVVLLSLLTVVILSLFFLLKYVISKPVISYMLSNLNDNKEIHLYTPDSKVFYIEEKSFLKNNILEDYAKILFREYAEYYSYGYYIFTPSSNLRLLLYITSLFFIFNLGLHKYTSNS